MLIDLNVTTFEHLELVQLFTFQLSFEWHYYWCALISFKSRITDTHVRVDSIHTTAVGWTNRCQTFINVHLTGRPSVACSTLTTVVKWSH